MNKQFPFLLLLLCLLPALPLRAQHIGGTVVDRDDGTPVAGAMVLLKKTAGTVIRYAAADSEGRFTLVLPEAVPDSCLLEIRMMGYGTETVRPPFPEHLKVRLKAEHFELNEGVVRAEKVKVRGDTISFSVPTLISDDDRVLSDILVKLPGVEVDDKGYVRYRGIPITRLYIEGNDLLESRYNIATQNIDPRDVGTIHIYENHQPIKALDGLADSDRAALDITLKSAARGKWIASLQAEAGIAGDTPRVPYAGNGFLMNISRHFQTINTLRTDAAGNDIIHNQEVSTPGVFVVDLNDRDFSGRYRERNYLGLILPSAPVDPKRSRFNTSYSVSTDNRFILANGYSLGISGDYENNRLSSVNRMEQTYYREDGSRLTFFRDENRGTADAWYGSAAVKLNANTERLYLNNHLRFRMSGDGLANRLDGTAQRQEETGGRNLELVNSLNFISRTSASSAFSLSMLSQYAESGELLRVTAPGSGDTAAQHLDTRFFYNDIHFQSRFQFGRYLSLAARTNLEVLWRDFQSRLEGIGPVSSPDGVFDKTVNDLNLFYVKPQEHLSLTLDLRKFKAALSADAWYQYIRGEHRWAVNPALNLQYSFTSRFWMTAGTSYRISPIDEQEIYDGVIMQNYRYFSLGREQFAGAPMLYAGGGLNFQDPISGWFVQGHLSWTRSSSFENTRYFAGEYIVTQRSDNRVPYSGLNTSLLIEKSFLEIVGKVYAKGGYNIFNTSLRQNGDLTAYTGNGANAEAGFAGDVSGWTYS